VKHLVERVVTSLLIYMALIGGAYITLPLLLEMAEKLSKREDLINVLVRLLSATAPH
jgi:hypothetical protein